MEVKRKLLQDCGLELSLRAVTKVTKLTFTSHILLEKNFIITGGTLEDYLGCKITRDDATMTTYITQPHLLEKLNKKFGPELPSRKFKTPGTPGFISYLQKIEDKDVLPQEKMS